MAQTSGLWTTSGTPTGHQVASYTQAIASTMLEIAAACSGKEGVAPSYLNELAGSTTGANNARVATGGAMVDGKYYSNTANVDLTIDSANAGHYRIDRVVIRAVWASFTVSAVVIKNTVEDTTAPAITQTSGTTYDIMICQARVTDAGVVTITDERTWAVVATDGSTLENSTGTLRVKDLGVVEAKIGALAVTSGKIGADAVIAGKIADGAVDITASLANDIVDDTKVGNRVPQFYRRQGGSATEWATQGTTTYTPTTVRMQAGSITVAPSTTQAVTFPVAFSYTPLVFLCIISDTASVAPQVKSTGYAASGFTILNNSANAVIIMWLAIGPE